MSQLTRALFNEFRPFFNLLDDPFDTGNLNSRTDPFVWQSAVARPALNLSEDNGTYVIEAEVPGVKRENLDVRVGDGGRSLTIEGSVIRRGQNDKPSADTKADTSSSQTPINPSTQSQRTELTTRNKSSENQIGQYSPWSGTRNFNRTVWLPHPINPNDVRAKLEDGILTIRAGRANLTSFNVSIE